MGGCSLPTGFPLQWQKRILPQTRKRKKVNDGPFDQYIWRGLLLTFEIAFPIGFSILHPARFAVMSNYQPFLSKYQQSFLESARPSS